MVYADPEKGKDYDEIYEIVASLESNPQFIKRTMNVLQRNNADTKECLLSVTHKDLMRLRNCGVKVTALLMRVQEILREQENI